MSRWHQDPPDDDRFEDKPIDAADAPRDGEPWNVEPEDEPDPSAILKTAIDPAEHAAHVIIDALTTLEQELVKCHDLNRAHALKQLTKRAWQHANLVDGKASDVINRIVERRR